MKIKDNTLSKARRKVIDAANDTKGKQKVLYKLALEDGDGEYIKA